MDTCTDRISVCLGLAAALTAALISATPVIAAEEAASRSTPALTHPEAEPQHAPVELDGTVLFRVRGIASFPADKRAEAIAGRIEVLAADASVPPDAIRAVEADFGTTIVAGSVRVMVVSDADARLESVDRKVLAAVYLGAIRKAVSDHRQARSREALQNGMLLTAAATAILAAIIAFVVWLVRRLRATLEGRYRKRIQFVGIQSFQIVRAERIWGVLQRVLDGARAILFLVIAFLYLEYVLGLFPWTRSIANRMLEFVLDPLRTMGRGILNEIPDIVFLAILFFVTRYLLKLIRLFFAAVGRGEVALAGFERDWAEPTYKLLRVGVIVFALVVAYPYIPGSGSDAFKGISIFIGIVFSLGSSSAIANVIAGYMMTYRRAFRVGDRVKIGVTVGDVTEMRLQVTHLKTVKNEEVIVPNSTILNNEVVNYSTLARKEGLILHTTVGIGYETPWRQVEAMLLAAAGRTSGLMKEPPPFVRQKSLGDFSITYELNVYCDNAQAMNALYTDLHRNILDLFNEYGVQIMTPAYEGDPEQPKVVPKEQWFAEPAKRADPGSR